MLIIKGNVRLFSYVLYHQAYSKMTENKNGFGSFCRMWLRLYYPESSANIAPVNSNSNCTALHTLSLTGWCKKTLSQNRKDLIGRGPSVRASEMAQQNASLGFLRLP